ncbi:MAG: M23 family metallopeptidase [Deltaproteobacteria bacterium]|nr:M23 family metallopeptidase [Deltaproteobacteria bacterium]
MKAGGYHIIVVPRDPSKTRRIRLSSVTARLLALAGILAIPFLVGSIFSTVHYQNRLVVLNRRLSDDTEVLRQKELLASRLGNLERVVSRTEEAFSRLEAVSDVELGHLQKGLGPIETELTFQTPKTEELPKVDVNLGDWLERGGQVTLSAIKGKMGELGDRLENLNARIEEFYTLNQDKIRFVSAVPSLMPVEGWITSDFGGRRSPYGRGYQMHYGLDIASPTGSPVRAPADGEVIFAEAHAGYGRMILIDHGYGVTTLYGHASQLFVKEGDKIKRGDIIAAVGSTGSSTGPHLHYEVHVDGIPTDPLNYITE